MGVHKLWSMGIKLPKELRAYTRRLKVVFFALLHQPAKLVTVWILKVKLSILVLCIVSMSFKLPSLIVADY